MSAVAQLQPGGRLHIGSTVSVTWGVVKRSWGPILGLVLLGLLAWAIVGGIGFWMMRAAPGATPRVTAGIFWTLALLWLLAGVGYTITSAGVMHVVATDLDGRRVRFGESLGVGARHFLPVAGLTLVIMIGLMVGTMLFIVPGLMLLTAWSVAVPVQVIEGAGIVQSLKRSAFLTKGSRWAVFGLYALLVVVVGVIQATLVGIFGPYGGLAIQLPYVLVLTTLPAAIYCELRRVKEGGGATALAAVFD